MKQLVGLVSILLLSSCATGGPKSAAPVPQTASQPEFPTNQFRFDGNRITCFTGEGFEGYEGCLHIGDIWVGDSLSEIEGKLGTPFHVSEDESQGQLRGYALEGTEELLPYMILSVKANKVMSIQLTGTHTLSPYSFSSLRLGDPAEKIAGVLGPSGNISPVPEVQAERWDYYPLPISIEVKDGRVYSIRIQDPEDSGVIPYEIPVRKPQKTIAG